MMMSSGDLAAISFPLPVLKHNTLPKRSVGLEEGDCCGLGQRRAAGAAGLPREGIGPSHGLVGQIIDGREPTGRAQQSGIT